MEDKNSSSSATRDFYNSSLGAIVDNKLYDRGWEEYDSVITINNSFDKKTLEINEEEWLKKVG